MSRTPIAVATLALALAGCAVQPRIVAQTPLMAVVESKPDVAAATALAQGHCRAAPGGDRSAVLRNTQPITARAVQYSFECVSPEPPPPPPAPVRHRRHRRAPAR